MDDFLTWLERNHRTPVLSAPYGLTIVIAHAGRQGMTRREIGQFCDLEPKLLDRLLAAFVSTGQLTVTVQNDERVYRTVAAMGTLHVI